MQETEPSPTAAADESQAPELLEVPAGSWIYQADDPGSALFIIDVGEVDLIEQSSGEAQTVDRIGPGDFFGEMGVCGETRRAESARAFTACRLLSIDRDLFPQVLQAEPEVAIAMLARLARRIRERPIASSDAAAPAEAPEPAVAVERVATALVHEESGQRFTLSTDEETTLGRSGSAVEPDIDLSDLDPHSTVSRAHAVILRTPDGLRVLERKPSTNGTFVDGERITPGEAVPLPSNCELTIGSVGLRLDSG